jgi:hypothetical protein
MFIREGLLDPLTSALLSVMNGKADASAEMKSKILQILLVFCQVSQSDNHVRLALGTRKIVRRRWCLFYPDLEAQDSILNQGFFEHAKFWSPNIS